MKIGAIVFVFSITAALSGLAVAGSATLDDSRTKVSSTNLVQTNISIKIAITNSVRTNITTKIGETNVIRTNVSTKIVNTNLVRTNISTKIGNTNLVRTNIATKIVNTNSVRTNIVSTTWKNPLAQYDTDKNCVITSNELATASAAIAAELQARFLAASAADKNQARLLAVYDLDDDGIISPDESLTVHQVMADREIGSLLARFDLNHDGNITCDEIRAVLSSGARTKTSKTAVR